MHVLQPGRPMQAQYLHACSSPLKLSCVSTPGQLDFTVPRANPSSTLPPRQHRATCIALWLTRAQAPLAPVAIVRRSTRGTIACSSPVLLPLPRRSQHAARKDLQATSTPRHALMADTRSSSAMYVANVRRSTRSTLACSSLAPPPSAAATRARLAGSARNVSYSSLVRASSAGLLPCACLPTGSWILPESVDKRLQIEQARS